jgi:putative transposase
MPRRPRYEEAGAVHHVYARGVNRRTIYEDEQDRHVYLDLLGYIVREWRWDCLAYCLMTNHVHLLVRTREPNLGEGMQRLHSLYAQGFNQRHGRVGHLFQDRYGSSRLWSEARVRHIARYIAANPVAAGLCADAADWEWGSFGAIASGESPQWLARPDEVLSIQAELEQAASYAAQVSSATSDHVRGGAEARVPASDSAASRRAA